MGKIIAVCKSDRKKTSKRNVLEGFLKENYGLIGDAHSDYSTHRQVSLLAMESIEKMRELGLNVVPGDFAENLTTEKLDLTSLSLRSRLSIGEDAILEITQIGKECHNPCAIYHQVGECIMPKEGVFARVINGGKVKIGDKIKILQS